MHKLDANHEKKNQQGLNWKCQVFLHWKLILQWKLIAIRLRVNPLFPTGRPHPSRESMVVLQWSPYMPQAIEMYQYVWRVESILVWTLKSKQFTDGNLLFLFFNKQNFRVVFYLIANNWQFLISRVKMAIDNHWDLVIWPLIGLKVDARIWCVTSLVNFNWQG